MKSPSCQKASVIVEVSWSDRWYVYQRLQQLGILCSCAIDQPLQVEITNTLAAIQLWSISRQLNTSRQELVEWLERCL